MHKKFTYKELDKIFKLLNDEYDIYAPKRFIGKGKFSDTDLVKYAKINASSEIEWKEKSAYSPKDIVFPITQTTFYFVNNNIVEKKNDSDRKVLIFLRACDINGIDRLDKIFLSNGPHKDIYYQRIREKIKYVLLECNESYDNCFCASMNANSTDDYGIAMKFSEESISAEIKDNTLFDYFKNIGVDTNYKPAFIQSNEIKVNTPDINRIKVDIFDDQMWEEYKRRCIACGRCNTTCITCSCFSTSDIAYSENVSNGERRRMWACCHVDNFTNMAGGHSFRKDNGSRMRFKTMHKIYDYNKRFGVNMCVGCGRCDDNCPEYISFANCINKVNDLTKGGSNV